MSMTLRIIAVLKTANYDNEYISSPSRNIKGEFFRFPNSNLYQLFKNNSPQKIEKIRNKL